MRQRNLVLGGFVLFKFLLQYTLIDPSYELHRDEYLHLDQANHPAWGYLSVPPFTSWNAALIQLLGNSEFWVKFFPALWGALTLALVWKTVEFLKGGWYALILSALAILLSVLLRLNTLFQPNSMDVLCWTAVYFLLIRYLYSSSGKWIYGCAIVFALGFLNKYSIVFLPIGLFPAVLVVPERTQFLKRDVLGAGIVALALVFPNLCWQYANGFPVIHHLAELSEKHLSNVRYSDFILAQLLFFAGAFYLILIGWLGPIWDPSLTRLRILTWSFIFTFVAFSFFKAKDYYVIGLYPIYLGIGAVIFSRITSKGWCRTLRPVAILLPLLFYVPMHRWVFPNRKPEYIVEHQKKYEALGLLRWEDGENHSLPQDFADMLGWKELAEKVDRVFLSMPPKENTIVLCDNYGQAGAINYYSKTGIRAASFHGDYLNWFELDKPYRHLIRVKGAGASRSELSDTAPHFEKSAAVDSITHPYSRERGTVIFRFEGAKVDINPLIEAEIREKKRKWEPAK